jgi:hypothetical protein
VVVVVWCGGCRRPSSGRRSSERAQQLVHQAVWCCGRSSCNSRRMRSCSDCRGRGGLGAGRLGRLVVGHTEGVGGKGSRMCCLGRGVVHQALCKCRCRF